MITGIGGWGTEGNDGDGTRGDQPANCRQRLGYARRRVNISSFLKSALLLLLVLLLLLLSLISRLFFSDFALNVPEMVQRVFCFCYLWVG